MDIIPLRLLTSITVSDSGCSPRRATLDFSDSGNFRGLVSNRHKDDSLMREERQSGGHRSLCEEVVQKGDRVLWGKRLLTLTTVLGGGGGDDGSHLSVECLGSPESSGRVEECRSLPERGQMYPAAPTFVHLT